MALTLFLGALFLGVKAYEYRAKFAHGIYPQKPHSLVHEKPDVYYAAAVHQLIKDRQEQLTVRRQTLQNENKDLSESEAERLQKLGVLEIGLARWSEELAAQGDTQAIEQMAEAINPGHPSHHEDAAHEAERVAAIRRGNCRTGHSTKST